MAQIVANKRKICFFGFDISYPANGFDGFMIGDIAAQPIYRIRRVNDQPAFSQHFRNLFNGSRIGIFRVDLYKHGYFEFRIFNIEFKNSLIPGLNRFCLLIN